eukprot:Gb_04304 [translate_table: standard]
MDSNTSIDFDLKLDMYCISTDTLAFGDDGGNLEFLENASVPCVSRESKESSRALGKYNASKKLKHHDLVTTPNSLIQGYGTDQSELLSGPYPIVQATERGMCPIAEVDDSGKINRENSEDGLDGEDTDEKISCISTDLTNEEYFEVVEVLNQHEFMVKGTVSDDLEPQGEEADGA